MIHSQTSPQLLQAYCSFTTCCVLPYERCVGAQNRGNPNRRHSFCAISWGWGFLVTYLIERYFSMLKVFSAFGIQLFYLHIHRLIILNDTSVCCKKPSQTVLCTGHVMMMNHISRDFSPSFSLPWMW